MARLQVPKEDVVLVNKGVEIRLSRDYTVLEQEAVTQIEAILAAYPKAEALYRAIVADPEVRANWDMGDYLVVAKMGFNDHGEVHHKVVTAAACSLLQLLIEAEVPPDVVTSGAGDVDDTFAVVVAASLLHDIGNQIHRHGHPEMGIVLVMPILERLLTPIYPEPEQKYELRAFILHAIRTHDIDVNPLTLEAAVVSVADACDCSKGRSRYAFDSGSISIHTVSGVAVERVMIERGQQKPVLIRVELSNAAGIFGVGEFLLPKINIGAMAPHTELVVTTEQGESDELLLYTVELRGKTVVARAPDGSAPPAPSGPDPS
jgi:metal-dependent HD superfamily phosphatase/phosphodiesterase